MIFLVVGDFHVQMNNLEDSELIFDRLRKIVAENRIDAILFLGDLFHTHSVVRQEVIDFYRRNMPTLRGKMRDRPIVIVGNHDGNSPTSIKLNAVRLTLGDIVQICDEPEDIAADVVAVPFMADNEAFVAACNQKEISHKKILFCHQTFDGSKYENQFPAPNGVDPARIPQSVVIAGHIHMEQYVGKVHYIGTPRALTASDVNQSKGVWLFDTETMQCKKIVTDDIVKCFKAFTVTEGDPNVVLYDSMWKPKDNVRVYVHGSEQFYQYVLEANKHLLGKVGFIPNIKKDFTKSISIEQDNNVEAALKKYVHEIAPIEESLKSEVWTKLKSLMPTAQL